MQEAFRQGRWEVAGEQDESSDPGWMLPLVLVSHCFSTFLATSAEASFYDQQRPLPFSELYREDGTGLLGLLKYALWQVCPPRTTLCISCALTAGCPGCWLPEETPGCLV